jgi:poly(hydroxyalkanoate) depolymerase family esterase
MTKRDWRELYASNQAAIARAGLASPAEVLNLTDVGAVPNTRLGAAPALDRLSTVGKMGHGALVHVPRGLDRATPAPLVCMLHGCTQDPAAFAAATLMNDTADRHGFVVLYPGQAVANNPTRCWNWFLPQHQRRDEGEPAAIAGLVRDLIGTSSECMVDPARVFVAGLSAGGAMAAILAACYPDLFAAAAVHSGLGYGAATSMTSAFEVMAGADGDADAQGLAAYAAMGNHARPVPSIVIHGNADRTVATANAINVLRTAMIANHLAAPDTCDHDVTHPTSLWHGQAVGERPYTQSRWADRRGVLMHELIEIDGLGHAWSGGAAGHPHTDPQGLRASDAIWTFFALTTAGAALAERPAAGTAQSC